MAYIDSGIDLCPILSKLDIGGVDSNGSERHSILCKCNKDGTFSYNHLEDIFDSDGGICTFIKETYNGPSLTSYNCNFWDFTNERCSLKTTDYLKSPDTEEDNLMIQLEKVIGKTSERDEDNSSLVYFIEYFNEVLGRISEKLSAEGTGSSLLREINHMHSSHWHPFQHECPEIPANCGYTAGYPSFGTPYATVLIAEYMSSQDLDGNGYIYGRDFMIEDSYDKPIMLKPIELTQEWEDPDIKVSWSDMLNWSQTMENNPL